MIGSKYLITHRAFISIIPHGPHNSPVLKTILDAKWNGPFSKDTKLIDETRANTINLSFKWCYYLLNACSILVNIVGASHVWTLIPGKNKNIFLLHGNWSSQRLFKKKKNYCLRSHRDRAEKNCILLWRLRGKGEYDRSAKGSQHTRHHVKDLAHIPQNNPGRCEGYYCPQCAKQGTD